MKLYSAKNLSALLLIPVICLAFTRATDKVNFSGTWALNEAKSELGQRGRFAAKTIKVEQKDNSIVITRTSPGFNGGDDVTTTETLGFDGKEVQSTGFGNSTKKSTLTWAADGQTLTISSNTSMERNGQTFEFSAKETWSLIDGGKSISIVTVSSSQRGESTIKAVYDKE
jgi:hypothetical protein